MRSSYIRQFHEWGQKDLTRGGPKDIVVGKGVLDGRMAVGCSRLGSMGLDGMVDHTTLHGLFLHGLLALLFLHDLFFLHDLPFLHDLLFHHVLDLILKEKNELLKIIVIQDWYFKSSLMPVLQ